jgi:hypothetical protein
MIDLIREAWGWTGAEPVEIIASNAFGNIIFRDGRGRFWRLCPEDVYCEVIADNRDEYEDLIGDSEFVEDWEMQVLVDAAYRVVGPIEPDRKYCLKIPGALGGTYEETNIASAPWTELILFSGDLAFQIKDLPDGSQIEFKVGD